jgi:hypothetical protein
MVQEEEAPRFLFLETAKAVPQFRLACLKKGIRCLFAVFFRRN